MTITEIQTMIENLEAEKWLLNMADHFTPEERDRDTELRLEIYRLRQMLPQKMPDYDNMIPNPWELKIWQDTTYRGIPCKEYIGDMTIEQWREMKKQQWYEVHGSAGV